MASYKTVRLAIHPGRSSTSWSMVLRTDDGRTVFDRRLHAGVLADIGVVSGVRGISAVLREIADEVDRRHGEPPPEAGREPLGALGGGSPQEPPPEG